LGFVGFFVWIYLSIVKVWRVSLRLQAALLLAAALSPTTIGPGLAFSVRSLSLPFSLLAAVWAVTMSAVMIHVAISLWGVSRSPEKAAFVAALDPRLAPGWWAYLNKLVDLPRTPFTSWRTVSAYGLSLTGAILMVLSMAYLMSGGAIQNSLVTFEATCSPGAMAVCAAQSRDLALQILGYTAVSIGGLGVAAGFQAAAKRLGGSSISDVLRSPTDRFVLYLRSFEADRVVLPKPRLPFLSGLLSLRPFPLRVEDELFDVSDGYRPLVAIGDPKAPNRATGGMAYREYKDDAHWQDYVLEMIHRSESIVIIVRNSEGVLWELSRIIAQGAARKTLFLFDPSAKDPSVWSAIAASILPVFAEAGLVGPAFAFAGQPLGFYFETPDVVEVQNSHWTATSYRTAFSQFLASRLVKP
jgi:hypothetical protein